MSYWEVLFICAEAAARGWTTEVAATVYRDAIRANMQWLGTADADIAAHRTGYPGLTPGPAAITDPVMVARRLTYPLIEQSLNKASHDEAVTRQGGVDMEDRVAG